MVKTNDPGIADDTWLMSIKAFLLGSVARYLQQYTSSKYCDVKNMSNGSSSTITIYAL